MLLRNRQPVLTIGQYLVTGTLKGYDALMNLVLDEVQEVMRGMSLTSLYPYTPSGN